VYLSTCLAKGDIGSESQHDRMYVVRECVCEALFDDSLFSLFFLPKLRRQDEE